MIPREGLAGDVPGTCLSWILGDPEKRELSAASVVDIQILDDGPHFYVKDAKAWRANATDLDVLRGLAAQHGIDWPLEPRESP